MIYEQRIQRLQHAVTAILWTVFGASTAVLIHWI